MIRRCPLVAVFCLVVGCGDRGHGRIEIDDAVNVAVDDLGALAFSGDSRHLYWAGAEGKGAALFHMELGSYEQTKLTTTDRPIREIVAGADTVLFSECLTADGKGVGPRRIWSLDRRTGMKQVVDGPWRRKPAGGDPLNLMSLGSPSPDGRYAVVTAWLDENTQACHFVEPASLKTTTASIPGEMLVCAGWLREGDGFVPLLAEGFDWPRGRRKTHRFEPSAGRLSPLDDPFVAENCEVVLDGERRWMAPDLQYSVAIEHGGEGVCVVASRETGTRERMAVFSPNGVQYSDDPRWYWASANHVVFQRDGCTVLDVRRRRIYRLTRGYGTPRVHFAQDMSRVVVVWGTGTLEVGKVRFVDR